MTELLVSAGLTAAACASLFETWNERSRFHTLSRSVIVRQIPPIASSTGVPPATTKSSNAISAEALSEASPPQAEAPVQSTNLPSAAAAQDTFDNGIRISHGGPSAHPPGPFPSGSSGPFSYSYSGSWGGPFGGWPSAQPDGSPGPFRTTTGMGLPGFPFNPFFPMMGVGMTPMLQPGRQLYRNPDGSVTEVTVSGSNGLEDSNSTWLNRKLYYYGLVPSAAVWRTHRVCSLQAPFLAQLGMWRSCLYLGMVIPFQTVYTVCIINSVAQWLTGLGSASSSKPVETTSLENGFWESSMQDPLKRHLGFDESSVSLYGDQSSVSMNMSSPGRWLSKTSTALVWNFAVWPGLVFLGTSFVTIPAAVLGARIAFAVRARNAFATGGPLAPFGA